MSRLRNFYRVSQILPKALMGSIFMIVFLGCNSSENPPLIIATAEPGTYAYGKLVLWTTDSVLTPSLDLLSNSEIKPIAMPNPFTTPYGLVAEESTAENLIVGDQVAVTSKAFNPIIQKLV